MTNKLRILLSQFSPTSSLKIEALHYTNNKLLENHARISLNVRSSGMLKYHAAENYI